MSMTETFQVSNDKSIQAVINLPIAFKSIGQHQGSMNSMHGEERAVNVHVKRFSCAQNYVHANQSNHL